MAEAVLSALLQVIFEKSTSETFETYALLRGTEKEMRKLQGVLSTIQAVLEDAEDRQAMDKAVKNWLIKLKDVAYDADDLLEEYMTEASRRRLESHDYKKLSRFMLNEVRYFFSQSNPILFRYQMRNKLENIAERLDAVADERFKFHLGDRLADSRIEVSKRLSVPTGTRYLSVFCADNKIPRGSRNACKLRSFLLLSGHWKTAEVSRKLILSLKSLRSLDISNTGIKKISKSIGLMIHLRYLDLSSTLIKRLPNTVCSLFNLQSLILKHCTRLEKLPKDMRKLINLRHLNLSDCRLLNKLPNGIGDLRSLQTLPVFIVGKEASCSIAELQNLDLHGELEIRNLENVSNSRCSKSAKRANLKEKWNLQSLKLWWEHVDEVHVKENVEHVIEGLQPSFELKKLEIKNYVGSKFPGWLMNPCLTNLVELSLIKCQRCVQLPLLQKLPALEVLTINEMEATMYFCNDLQGNAGGNGFVSLKTLSIENMSNLLGWTTNGGQLILPSLKQLVIDGCPNLGSLPELPSVASMKLDDCSMDLLRMVTRITTLSDLIISGFSELVQLPQGLLKSNPSLLSLEIRDCLELRSFSGELQTLGPLQCLTISNCPELESFSELSGLSSLESLWIDRCDSLVSMPGGMTRLNSLRHVSFSDCENLAALPEAIKYLTCLQTLNIFSCPALETLPEWLGNLVALREMELCYCENLLRLPQSMQRLTALQFLLIRGCPCLEMRCKKDTGADWHKIRHIPFIKINGPYIQALSGKSLLILQD
ncbi:hypothetical protein SCA6_015473 [Theobroma cacao]